jgi:hypothetical protein
MSSVMTTFVFLIKTSIFDELIVDHVIKNKHVDHEKNYNIVNIVP